MKTNLVISSLLVLLTACGENSGSNDNVEIESPESELFELADPNVRYFVMVPVEQRCDALKKLVEVTLADNLKESTVENVECQIYFVGSPGYRVRYDLVSRFQTNPMELGIFKGNTDQYGLDSGHYLADHPEEDVLITFNLTLKDYLSMDDDNPTIFDQPYSEYAESILQEYSNDGVILGNNPTPYFFEFIAHSSISGIVKLTADQESDDYLSEVFRCADLTECEIAYRFDGAYFVLSNQYNSTASRLVFWSII